MTSNGITTWAEGKVLDDDLSKFLEQSPKIDSRVYGPYTVPYYLTILGWVAGTNGDDDSKANLAMFINGKLAGSQSDQSFNDYYLSVEKTIRLEAGRSASVTVTHSNADGPTETGYSIDLIGWVRA